MQICNKSNRMATWPWLKYRTVVGAAAKEVPTGSSFRWQRAASLGAAVQQFCIFFSFLFLLLLRATISSGCCCFCCSIAVAVALLLCKEAGQRLSVKYADRQFVRQRFREDRQIKRVAGTLTEIQLQLNDLGRLHVAVTRQKFLVDLQHFSLFFFCGLSLLLPCRIAFKQSSITEIWFWLFLVIEVAQQKMLPSNSSEFQLLTYFACHLSLYIAFHLFVSIWNESNFP